MTEIDAQRIEQALGVTLPGELRSIWLNYPLKAEAGNAERCIWDHADAIIKENLRLRDIRHWPPSLLLIGSDGAGNQFALDLARPQTPVGIAFEDPDQRFDPLEQWDVKRKTLAAWFSAVIKEMVDDGYDIDTGKSQNGAGTGIFTGTFMIVLGLVIVGVVFFAIGSGMKFGELLFNRLFGS